MVFQRALSYGQALATEEIKGSELETFTYRREAELPPDLGEHSIPPTFPLWPLGGFGGGGGQLPDHITKGGNLFLYAE